MFRSERARTLEFLVVNEESQLWRFISHVSSEGDALFNLARSSVVSGSDEHRKQARAIAVNIVAAIKETPIQDVWDEAQDFVRHYDRLSRGRELPSLYTHGRLLWHDFATSYQAALRSQTLEGAMDLVRPAQRLIDLNRTVSKMKETLEEEPWVTPLQSEVDTAITVHDVSTLHDLGEWALLFDELLRPAWEDDLQPNRISDSSVRYGILRGLSPTLVSVESGAPRARFNIIGDSDWITKALEIAEKVIDVVIRRFTREGQFRSEVENLRLLNEIGIDVPEAGQHLAAYVVERAALIARKAKEQNKTIEIGKTKLDPTAITLDEVAKQSEMARLEGRFSVHPQGQLPHIGTGFGSATLGLGYGTRDVPVVRGEPKNEDPKSE